MIKRTLLAIDPGSREFGFGLFRSDWLEDSSVKSLRRSHRHLSRLNVLQKVFTKMLECESVNVLALEKNSFDRIPQNQLLTEVIRKMVSIANRHQVPVYEFAPNTIKKAVTGDATATKRMVAKVIYTRYRHLKIHMENKHRWQERYNLNMFDAVACGLAFLKFEREDQLQNYEIAT